MCYTVRLCSFALYYFQKLRNLVLKTFLSLSQRRIRTRVGKQLRFFSSRGQILFYHFFNVIVPKLIVSTTYLLLFTVIYISYWLRRFFNIFLK
jgi:hypothetical protein